MSQWYYTSGGAPLGPISDDELQRMIRLETIGPYDLVWREGMAGWATAATMPELFPPGSAPPNPPPPLFSSENPISSQRLAAGLCGILVGAFGAHKFVLGKTSAGLTMLLVTILTCGAGAFIMGPLGLVEGIIYLTKSDADFYQTYIVEGRNWL